MSDRKETFLRWWVYQLRTFDCDSSIYLMKYVINRLELNTEQRYWFCWLYANTYQVATAWVLFNEFPDYENASQDRITKFSRDNITRLPYQKDQKWLRGKLGDTFASYRANLGKFSQQEYFATVCAAHDPLNAFDDVWATILNCYRLFGRYTAWFYLQALKEICGLNIQARNLMLNFDSSATHRAGLCLALGKDDWAVKGTKFTAGMLEELDAGAAELLYLANRHFPLDGLPVQDDYFSMETSLCSFKKLFRLNQGRYLGYYLDRQAEDIQKTQACDWPGINWDLLWDGRNESIRMAVMANAVDKSRFGDFMHNGVFHNDPYFESLLTSWFDQHYK